MLVFLYTLEKIWENQKLSLENTVYNEFSIKKTPYIKVLTRLHLPESCFQKKKN